MARTKQTARKSTGGNAPRKMLAADAAFGNDDDESTTTNPFDAPFHGNPLASLLQSGDALPVEALRKCTGGVTPEQAALATRDAELRSIFAGDRAAAAALEPCVGLVKVFDDVRQFDYAPESPGEAAQAKILTKHWNLQASGSAVGPGGLDGFRARFDAFTCGAFKQFDWSHCFVAGGAVLGSLLPNDGEQHEAAFANSDVDIFIVGIDDEAAATAKLQQIYRQVCANLGRDALVIRTLRAVTILGKYPERHIQIILKLFLSPAEVLLSFDIDACAVGFDGTNVWAMERCRRALTKRYNLVDTTRRSLSYETRLAKYAARGFAVAVPGLDAARIDTSTLRYAPLHKLQGARKLVALDLNQRRHAQPASFTSLISREAKGDYTFDFARSRQVGTPLYKAKHDDRATIFSRTQRQPQTVHQHVFVTSIEGVTQPGFDWCRLCRSKTPLAEPTADSLSAHAPFVTPQVRWDRDCLVYQDLDQGQQRRLLIGSFQTDGMNPDWFADLYSGAAASSTASSVTYTTVKAAPAASTAPAAPAVPASPQWKPTFGTPAVKQRLQTFLETKASSGTPDVSAFGGGSFQPFYAEATVPSPWTPPVSAFGGGSFQPQFVTAPAAPATPAVSAFGGGSGGGGDSFAAPSLAAFGGGSVGAVAASDVSAYAPAQPFASANAQRRAQLQAGGEPAPAAPAAPAVARRVDFDAPAQAAYRSYEQAAPAYAQERTVARALFQGRDREQLHVVLACANTVQAKCLLAVSFLSKCGALTAHQKQALKRKALARDAALAGVVQAYEVDQDLNELIDSLSIVVQQQQ